MAGKKLKVLLGTNNTEKLPILTQPKEEVDLRAHWTRVGVTQNTFCYALIASQSFRLQK